MEWLIKLIEAFNGNKTVIGLVLLQVSQYVPEPWKTYCIVLGTILTGVGVTHKAIKISIASVK